MGKHSIRRFYLIFAAWTFLAVGIVATVVTILQIEALGSQTESDVAAAVSRAVLPALGLGSDDLTSGNLASFEASASSLLSEDLHAIRLWDMDGQLLAEIGEATPADRDAVLRAAAQGTTTEKAGSPSGDVLTSYVRIGPTAVVEFQQDYDAVASSASTGRGRILLISLSGAAIALILLQTILWGATRTVRKEYDQLLYLYKTGQAVRSTLDLSSVLEQLCHDAAIYTLAPLAVAALLEEDNEMIVRASYGPQEGTSAQHHRKVEVWHMRRSAVTGETVIAPKEAFPYREVLGHNVEDDAVMSVLNVPIPGRERACGVLTLVRPASLGAFRQSEIQMAEEMAGQAGLAVGQATLFNKVRSYAEEVELSYDGTLRALMAALDSKDSLTQGHSERVARLTVALAKEMGVPDEHLLDIERGALLHDVGKIGVPDAVLQKPSSLDDSEWEAMEKHPLLAGLMVSNVGFLEGTLPILLYHHERFDGTGYPFRLEKKAIPLEARIFTVVDSYDAMTFDRPYRKAMPKEVALREIQNNSGTQFDPEVVEAFVRLMGRAAESERSAA